VGYPETRRYIATTSPTWNGGPSDGLIFKAFADGVEEVSRQRNWNPELLA